MYENKEHIIYSAADIRRYLNGQMTRDEMYALEKQAAEDPFLADALEGYTGITIEAAEADLAVLRSRLNKEEDKKAKVVVMKPGGFKWWKQGIAAAIAGLVIFAAATFLKGDKKDQEIAANNPSAKTEATTTPNTAPSGNPAEEQANEAITNTTQPQKTSGKAVFISPDSIRDYYLNHQRNNDDVKQELKPNAAAGENRYYAEEDKFISRSDSAIERKKTDDKDYKDFKVITAEDVNKKEVATNATRSGAPSSPQPVNTEKSRQVPDVYTGNAATNQVENVAINDRRRAAENKFEERAVSPAAKRAASPQRDNEAMNDNFGGSYNIARNYMFNYRVTDNNGNSIPFSNISIPADQLITYSRSDGSFGLFSADTVLRVNVKAAGYEPKSFLLRNNTQPSNLTLNEESLAKDKNLVIVGDQKNFALRKANKAKSAAEKEEAEPLDGWGTYDAYLANNIDITNKNKGEVELSFEVGKKGEIKSVTVEKSLGAKEDQEAIRLVTQGPKWKGKKKKSKGRVIVTF